MFATILTMFATILTMFATILTMFATILAMFVTSADERLYIYIVKTAQYFFLIF